MCCSLLMGCGQLKSDQHIGKSPPGLGNLVMCRFAIRLEAGVFHDLEEQQALLGQKMAPQSHLHHTLHRHSHINFHCPFTPISTITVTLQPSTVTLTPTLHN